MNRNKYCQMCGEPLTICKCEKMSPLCNDTESSDIPRHRKKAQSKGLKYEPVECFLPIIDQSTVDNSTELWLDKIEESAHYLAWLCGHWHIDKRIDKIHFLFDSFESSEEIHNIKTEEVSRRILEKHKKAFLELAQ